MGQAIVLPILLQNKFAWLSSGIATNMTLTPKEIRNVSDLTSYCELNLFNNRWLIIFKASLFSMNQIV